jgi:hypothetical protein
MPKIPDDILLDVAGFCIKYLNDRYSNERGLFRFAVSQTDVRQLQTQIAQKTVTHRDDLDPHLVAEVLQTTFRDLESPLLHEVYVDILSTDPQQNEYTENKINIQQWLQKLPERKRSLMHSYFRLLSRLAAVEETDASLNQLAYSISPTICRPLNCAFMSLRHKEDLNKIRPAILFLIENYGDIFTFTKSFHMGHNAFAMDKDSRDAMLSDMMTSAMVIDPSNKSTSGMEVRFISSDTSEDDIGGGTAMPFVKPSLMLSIPGINQGINSTSGINLSSNSSAFIPSSLSFSSLSSGGSSDESDLISSTNINTIGIKDWQYSDSDWKVFHALVCHKVSRFLDFSDNERHEYMQAESEGDGHHAVMQSWTAKVNLAAHNNSLAANKLDPSGMPPSTNTSSQSPSHHGPSSPTSSAALSVGTNSGSGATSTSGSTNSGSPSIMGKKYLSPKSSSLYSKSYSRRNRRRKMVAECKGLRQQIQEFEQGFLLQNSRMPKAQERGDMNQLYVKYRELKKDIRETAAKDMQRVIRGFLARRLVLKLLHGSASDEIFTVGKTQSNSSATTKSDAMMISPEAAHLDSSAIVSPRDSSVSSTKDNTFFGGIGASGGNVSLSTPGVISSSSAAAAAASYNSNSSTSASTVTSTSNSSLSQGTLSGSDLGLYRPSGSLDDDVVKFRELLYAKRDLKRTLKKFDTDFMEQHNRQPKKADKESMRPMYQKYQEIKTSIEILRVHMQNFENQIPDDLRNEVFGAGGTVSAAVSPTHNMNLTASNISESGKRSSAASNSGGDIDMEDIAVETSSVPSSTRSTNSTVELSSTGSASSSGKTSSGGSKSQPTLDELTQEKKHLHEYLKVYERDFNRIHGRPVMKNEDILPVAAEYQRYKELKNLIKELK